jgi:hypothetical protein
MTTEVYTATKDNKTATVYLESDNRYSIVTIKDTAIIGEDTTSVFPNETIAKEAADFWINDDRLLDRYAISFWKNVK